jgi:hypothetical protein
LAISNRNEALIAIIGTLWVATSTVISTSQVINERRDVVLSGQLDGRPIAVYHRELILHHDWLPMAIASGLACLVFAVFLCLVPRIFKLEGPLRIFCFAAAIVPAVGGLSWLLGGVAEFQLMDETLRAASAPAASR